MNSATLHVISDQLYCDGPPTATGYDRSYPVLVSGSGDGHNLEFRGCGVAVKTLVPRLMSAARFGFEEEGSLMDRPPLPVWSRCRALHRNQRPMRDNLIPHDCSHSGAKYGPLSPTTLAVVAEEEAELARQQAEKERHQVWLDSLKTPALVVCCVELEKLLKNELLVIDKDAPKSGEWWDVEAAIQINNPDDHDYTCDFDYCYLIIRYCPLCGTRITFSKEETP